MRCTLVADRRAAAGFLAGLALLAWISARLPAGVRPASGRFLDFSPGLPPGFSPLLFLNSSRSALNSDGFEVGMLGLS